MELRATREMRRNEQLSKAMAKKADVPAKAQAQAQPARTQAPRDKVSLSRQALSWLELQDQIRQAKEHQAAEKQGKGGELELLKKGQDVLDKCLKIAASIRKGDKVPPEDLEYLQDNDPAGYALAMAQRHEKKNPEEVESMLDEEDRNGSARESGGGGGREVSSASAAASSGSGDGAAPSAK